MTDELSELRIFLEQKAAAQQCGGWDVNAWSAGPAWGPLRCPRCGRAITGCAVPRTGVAANPPVEGDERGAGILSV